MKIWSATLTPRDLTDACGRVNADFPGADVYLEPAVVLHAGPRTRRLDYVHLRSRRGMHYPNSGVDGAATWAGRSAASWTEWGWFLARVFERDPDARCGDYHGREDFDAKTGGRFIEPRSPRERQIKRALKVAS